MNALLDPNAFSETVATPPDFELARSRLLDAFFELEIAATKWLRHLGEKGAPRPLGQRLEQLARHPRLATQATPKQTKEMRALPQKLEGPLGIRNAAVHSRRVKGAIEGKACYLLTTIDHALSGAPNYLAVTLDEIEEARRVACHVAGHLTNYLNQASSPPPPSRAAAAGP